MMRAPYPHRSDLSGSLVDVSNRGRRYSDFVVDVYDHFRIISRDPQRALGRSPMMKAITPATAHDRSAIRDAENRAHLDYR